MAKLNKICICDNTKYSYCPTCAADNSKPAWMNMYCSENCKNLFQAATDYNAGEINFEDAKKIVEKADLSNKDNFKPSIVRFIDEVLSDKPVKVEIKEDKTVAEEVKAKEVKVDSETSDEVTGIFGDIETVEPRTKKNKKRNFDKNED